MELRRPSTTGYILAQGFVELLGQAMTACSHIVLGNQGSEDECG